MQDLPSMQLYDMYSDPKETKNLVEEYPEKAKELKSLMIKYIEEGRSTPGNPQKNDFVKQWKQKSEIEKL